MTNCVVCHNPDPNLPGSQGPAIAGASAALLRARLLHLAYPPGYRPQRDTHLMRAFPKLAGKIGDLAAFLKASKDRGHRQPP
jgi:mono/diheme cytochrome c family protein